MSLIRSVVRLCAVAALRDRTWAESRVYDSDSTPLLDALNKQTKQTKPYITVFTDEHALSEIYGRDLYTSDTRMSLVLEYGIASAAQVKVKDEEGTETVLNIPQTDQSLELLVDLIETQIIYALVSDPNSPFGELLRRMINRFVRVPSIRGGASDKTTRWAARQMTMICDVISSPPPGVVLYPDHPVRDFMTMARSAEYLHLGMKEAADIIDKMINEVAAPEFRQGQAWQGLTEKGIQGTGISIMHPNSGGAGNIFNHPRPEWDEALSTGHPPLERDDAHEPPEEPE